MSDSTNTTGSEVLGYGKLNQDGSVSFMSPVSAGPGGSVKIGGNGGHLIVKTTPTTPPSGYNWQTITTWMLNDYGIIVPEWQISSFNENARVPFVIYPYKPPLSSAYVLMMHLPANSIVNNSQPIPIQNAQGGDIRVEYGTYRCYICENSTGSLYAIVGAGSAPSADIIYSFDIATITHTMDGSGRGVVQVEQKTFGAVHFDDLLGEDSEGGGGGDGSTSKKPFGIYKSSESDESDESLIMYVPEGSLVIDSEVVEVSRYGDNSGGTDEIDVDVGTYWCVIKRPSSGDPKYVAQIMTGAEKTSDRDPSVFSFKIAEISSGGDVSQFAYGTVHLGPLPEIEQLTVFQVASVTYEDESESSIRYRIFVPRGATLNYNGMNLDIENADGDWFDLSRDVGRADGILRYYCVVKDFSARILDETEFANVNVRSPRVQLVLPVLAVKTGDAPWSGDENIGGTDLGLLVTQRVSQSFREVPWADAEASAWAAFFARAKSVFQLKDEQNSKSNVLGAMQKVVEEADGIAMIYFCCHGVEGSGNLCLNTETLSPSEVAGAIAHRSGDVWLVLTSCYSGYFAGQSGSRTSAARFASEVSRLAAADGNPGGVLIWAAASYNEFSWAATDTGSYFTQACARHIVGDITFGEAWTAISTDAGVLEWQTPVASNSGFNANRSILFGAGDSDESDEPFDSDDSGDYSEETTYLKRVSIRNFVFGMKHVTDPSTLSQSRGGYLSAPNTRTAWHVYGISDGVDNMRMIYLPSDCLLYNGEFIPVDPPGAPSTMTRENDMYEIGNVIGDLFCSITKDAQTGVVSAKVASQKSQGALFTFPVCNVAAGNGALCVKQYASGIVTVSTTPPGPFEPILGDGEMTGVEDGVVQIGGYTVEVQGTSISSAGYVCVEVSCSSGVPDDATIVMKADASALRTAQQNLGKVTIPIYKVKEVDVGESEPKKVIEMDLRRMPSAGMLEAFLQDESE